MELTLDPIVTRRNKPFISFYLSIAGNEQIKIIAGDNLTVPNVYGVEFCLLRLAADVTVVNRYIHFTQYIDKYVMEDLYTAGIAASEDKTFVISKAGVRSNFYQSVPANTGYIQMGENALCISGDDYWIINAGGGVAGDVVSIKLLIKWLNWDLGMMVPRNQKDNR